MIAAQDEKLIQSYRLRKGSVSFGKRDFGKKTSKAREFRIHIVFPTASTAGNMYPVTVPHGLGRTPSAYSVVGARRNPASGPPGTVFDKWPWATKTHVTFFCTAANTKAEIVLR